MTCIVGLVAKDAIYMGADSAGVWDNHDLVVRSDPKVFRNGPYLIGYTSSFRMGQILRFHLKPPERKTRDALEYIVVDVISEIRKLFLKHGYTHKENNEETGGEFLLAYDRRLFQIGPDFQVGELRNQFAACGCGESFALGAMYANADKKPRARVLEALRAAQEFSGGVREPFVIKSLKYGK